MAPKEIKSILPSLVGKNVAVIYRGIKGPTMWGRVEKEGIIYTRFILVSFKTGLSYCIEPDSIEYIGELKCRPNEIRY